DHAQRDTPPLFVHFQNPNVDHVAHRHHFVGVLYIFIGNLTDMYQSTVGKPDVDERAEVDDVQHGAGQFHVLVEIFELHRSLAENRRGKVFARVAAGPGQTSDNIFQQQIADVHFAGELLGFQRFQA